MIQHQVGNKKNPTRRGFRIYYNAIFTQLSSKIECLHPLFQIEKNRSPKQTSYSTFTDRRTTDCFDQKQNILRICWLREKINSIGATKFDGQKFKWITNEFEQIFPTDTKHYFFLGSAAACPWASGFDQPNLIIKINCHCHCS